MAYTNVSQESRHIDGSSTMEKCAAICLDCYKTCNETLQYCLEKGGDHVRPSHLTLLLDCAKICQTSADFLTRGSEHHAITCRACAELCRDCADDCKQMPDQEMKQCAEVCERCAQSCQEMSAH